MNLAIQIGSDSASIWGIEPKDWLQFAGALLAASIAIALWFAERWRANRAERIEHLNALNNYKYAIALSAKELGLQLHEIVTYQKTVQNNYQMVLESSGKGTEDSHNENALLRNIIDRSGAIHLYPAPILNLSVEHARYLSNEQNELIAEVLSEGRSINYQMSMLSTDSVEEAVDTLNLVAEASHRASDRVDSLLSLLGQTRNGDV